MDRLAGAGVDSLDRGCGAAERRARQCSGHASGVLSAAVLCSAASPPVQKCIKLSIYTEYSGGGEYATVWQSHWLSNH